MNRDGKVQLFLAVIAIFLIALAVGLTATNLSAAQVSFLRGSVTSLSGIKPPCRYTPSRPMEHGSPMGRASRSTTCATPTFRI